MQTISDLVKDYIKSHEILEDVIVEGIVNYSALARIMRPEFEKKLFKKVELGSIVMALKRIEPHLQLHNREKIIQPDEIIIRSDLMEYTFHNTEHNAKRLASLVSYFEKNANAFFTITEGVFELAIIVSKKYADAVEKIYTAEKPIAKRTKLSALILRLPKENVVTPGVYYSILKKLNWEGINVIDVVSTNTEFTLILNDEEVGKAFAILK